MAASMPLPSKSESKHSVYFRCLLAIAVLIWPVGVVGQSSVSDNVVVQWDAAALQGVRDSRIGPPMVARALAIAHTCIFDAWAAYEKQQFVGPKANHASICHKFQGHLRRFEEVRRPTNLSLAGDMAGTFDSHGGR